ncbi:hypothetical protein ZWY2020_024254 [Hordeum vulgare]|nr:hypothetical protein ZWY2020_024254 [Hordeum vulgare]
MAAEEGEETRTAKETFLVRSEDDMDFVVSDLEACQSMVLAAQIICYDGKLIYINVNRESLSKVLHYCKKHATAVAASGDLSGWDSKFIGDLDLDTLYNVILKMHVLKNPNLDQKRALRLEENALRALHIVPCEKFTEYDPKEDFFICSRLSHPNIALFDVDKESRIARGPPLESITGPLSDLGMQSLLNIISFQVAKYELHDDSIVQSFVTMFTCMLLLSDHSYLFWVVCSSQLPGLMITYTCFDMVLLVRDDMLILTDLPRGIVLANEVYFETRLKIRCDGGSTKDLSKGMIYLSKACLPMDNKTIKVGVSSFLSRVEVECENIVRPVEATIAITILKGACNLGQVSAWAERNHGQRIILCRYRCALNHLCVFRPFCGSAGRSCEDDVITLRPSYLGRVYKMGWGQVHVQVLWTTVPKRNKYRMDVVGNVMLLH